MEDKEKKAILPHYNNVKYWSVGKEKFKKEVQSFKDFNNIFFNGQYTFFNELEESHPEEAAEFMKVYKYLKELALNLEDNLEKSYDLLLKETTEELKLTRKQVALIFLLSFFDIIPPESEIQTDNSIKKHDFIVSSILTHRSGACFQFGRCFVNYLTVIGNWLKNDVKELDEVIIFQRKNISDNDYIHDLEKIGKFCNVEINEKDSMFDGDATFYVDFANKYIGGGILSGGAVQEEIFFGVCTEAIVSIFFMEVMNDNDSIRIDNLIQYSDYTGYGSSFKFTKNKINYDDIRLKRYNIIAIDAVCFPDINNKISIQRDLHKAYVGFSFVNDIEDHLQKTIATGNWGCGAFGGDFELKFLQQWLAATLCHVDKLYYYTFNNKKMKEVVANYEKIRKEMKPIDVYNILMKVPLTAGQVLDKVLNPPPIPKNPTINLTDIDGEGEEDHKNNKCCPHCCIY